MRAIRHRDTKPEMLIRKALHARGFRYRVNVKTLPGTPDIVLPKHRVVVFVHGCFWHGHPCPMFKVPATRTAFWLAKIEGTIKRDIISRQNLSAGGWRVAIVWECALKGPLRLQADTLVNLLSEWILTPGIKTTELQGMGIEGVSHT